MTVRLHRSASSGWTCGGGSRVRSGEGAPWAAESCGLGDGGGTQTGGGTAGGGGGRGPSASGWSSGSVVFSSSCSPSPFSASPPAVGSA